MRERRSKLLIALAAVTLVAVCTRCAGTPAAPPPTVPSARLLETARARMAAGDAAAALEPLEQLLARADAESFREEAMYRQAVCLNRTRDRSAAFDAFQAFVEAYPLSRFSIEKEVFELGLSLIQGAGGGFLGIPRALGLTLTGPEVLRFLIKINPTGEYAADSRRIIAQYYFDEGDFHLARLEYEALIEEHPGSIWQPLAEYRIPLCRLLLSRGAVYDRKLLEDALEGFRDYERKHPGGDYADRARDHAREVYDMLAEKNYRTAEFYLADKHVDAGVFYHKLTIQEYPETEWAARSADCLARIARDYADTPAARVARDYLELIGK
jgi:outer membrane protein assembly factor BamD (BamD/ComL family)